MRIRFRNVLIACLSGAALASAWAFSPAFGQGAAGSPPTIDEAGKAAAIEQAAALLRAGYVYPSAGDRMAAAILKKLSDGGYAGAAKPGAFAAQLTADLRAVTPDRHLGVEAPADPTPAPQPAGVGPRVIVPSLAGFEHVQMLAGDIGYLDVTGFPPPQLFRPMADHAFARIAGARAIILDLRHNQGGSPASVAYLCSFFFDQAHKTHLNDVVSRVAGTGSFRTEEFWSEPTPTALAAVPVYVLVGAGTFSGGEEAAYDLQALKRAVIVGEATGGGANPTDGHPLPGGLVLLLPHARAENPLTRTNWEGVGVKPDKPVAAADALAFAADAIARTPGLGLPPRLGGREIAASVTSAPILPATAYPGSEAQLRARLATLAAGGQVEPPIGEALAEFSGSRAAAPSDLKDAGPITKVSFHGFDVFGGQEFTVAFQSRTTEWVLFTTPDGRFVALGYRPARTESGDRP